MTAHPPLDDAIVTRCFELDGADAVNIYIWKPERREAGDIACPYMITGIGSEMLCHTYGIDDVQAIDMALKTIGVWLYVSEEYKDGRLTFLGTPDLHMPLFPADRPGLNGYEPAEILQAGSSAAIVRIPGERFAFFALSGARLYGFTGHLDGVIRRMADGEAKQRLIGIRDGVVAERSWYQAVCKSADVDLPYVVAPEASADS